MSRRLLVSERVLALVIASLAVGLLAPTAQAELYSYGPDSDGRLVSADVLLEGTTLTITLTNDAPKPSTDSTALSGFFIDFTLGTSSTLTPLGDATAEQLVAGPPPGGTWTGTTNLWYGWDYDVREGRLGLSSVGGSGSGDGWYALGDGAYEGGDNLDGKDWEIISSSVVDQSMSEGQTPYPLVVHQATFTFTIDGAFELGGDPVWTFGTGPNFVTPLPGAVLLGMLGLCAAGLKLRKYA